MQAPVPTVIAATTGTRSPDPGSPTTRREPAKLARILATQTFAPDPREENGWPPSEPRLGAISCSEDLTAGSAQGRFAERS